MSAEAWDALAPGVAPALGGGSCEVAYGPRLLAGRADVAAALDEYTQASGPTDDLLAALAPAAKGDVLMVITVAGRPPSPESNRADAPALAQTTSPMGGGGRMGGAGGGGRRPRRRATPTDMDHLELTAALYSVPEKRPVGLVALEYTGRTQQDAVTRFGAALARALPGARCAGWDLSPAGVDAERIRQLPEP
jgi:hypothetical protein